MDSSLDTYAQRDCCHNRPVWNRVWWFRPFDGEARLTLAGHLLAALQQVAEDSAVRPKAL
jgi:hypothetical protein